MRFWRAMSLAMLAWAALFVAALLLPSCAPEPRPSVDTPSLERVEGDGGPFGPTMRDWQRREMQP